MSYRPRPTFDQPTAESVQRSRRAFVWIIPLVVIQQGTVLFGNDGAGTLDHVLRTLAWTAVTIAILWQVLGLPVRWLSERDQAILNDERSQFISAEAAKWGIAATVVLGCALMFAQIWIRIDAGLAIYGVVNGALLAAVARYAWLHRGEPDEDE
jgi:hypothetical protein